MIENFEIKKDFFSTPYEAWQDPWIGCTMKDIRRVNLIVGKNGSGKTLLLENIFCQLSLSKKYLMRHDIRRFNYAGSIDALVDAQNLIKDMAEIIGVTNNFKAALENNAVLRLMDIFLSFESNANGTVLIDGVGDHFHYSVMADVWKMIFELSEKFNVQVFAVTHSWDCIKGFAKASSDETGAIYRIGTSALATDHGKKITTRFGYKEMIDFIESNMEIR